MTKNTLVQLVLGVVAAIGAGVAAAGAVWFFFLKRKLDEWVDGNDWPY